MAPLNAKPKWKERFFGCPSKLIETQNHFTAENSFLMYNNNTLIASVKSCKIREKRIEMGVDSDVLELLPIAG